MRCHTAGISALETFVQLCETRPFFWCLLENNGELLLACQRAVPNCSRTRSAGCGWGRWQSCPRAGTWRPSSLDTNPEPFAFPFQQQRAALLLSHLCFSLCCGFLPAKHLAMHSHAFWALFSLLPPVSMVQLLGSCHRDNSLISTSAFLSLCERCSCPSVAWLPEPAASTQMCQPAWLPAARAGCPAD